MLPVHSLPTKQCNNKLHVCLCVVHVKLQKSDICGISGNQIVAHLSSMLHDSEGSAYTDFQWIIMWDLINALDEFDVLQMKKPITPIQVSVNWSSVAPTLAAAKKVSKITNMMWDATVPKILSLPCFVLVSERHLSYLASHFIIHTHQLSFQALCSCFAYS